MSANVAYDKGRQAYLDKKLFSSNPYKNPKSATDWSVGWTGERDRWRSSGNKSKLLKPYRQRVRQKNMRII